MVAHADREALECTLRTGEMHYRSRSRGLWHKGGTSGNVQRVVSLTADCDADAVLARVVPAGPACHNGTTSCFREAALQADVFATLDATITTRMQHSDETSGSYTQRLLGDRNLRLKKLGKKRSSWQRPAWMATSSVRPRKRQTCCTTRWSRCGLSAARWMACGRSCRPGRGKRHVACSSVGCGGDDPLGVAPAASVWKMPCYAGHSGS